MAPSADIESGGADKPCHNCRRRRLRCDRSVPQCSKCAARGIECLGYGQLFLWTGAVASRGKLAGQKSSAALYPAPGPPPRRPRRQVPASVATPSEAGSGAVTDLYADADAEADTEADADVVSSHGDDALVVGGNTQLVCPTSPTPLGYEYEASTPWVLIDPIFQDMKYSQRQYLAYFSSRLCRDFVAYDVPEHNPFRNLLPLTQAHPLLRQVIIAASAAHMYNRARPWLSPDSLDRGDGPRGLLVDALVAKQQVLQMMPSALQSINSIDGDVLLASVLFLINLELIESGKQNWKAHLDGAGRIMALLPSSTVDASLRNYVMSDCFVYYILESTFRPPVTDSRSFFNSCQGLEILRKTANSYYCCPPELLEIMLTAAQLSSTISEHGVSLDMVTTAGVTLFNRAQNIDVIAWAREVETLPSIYSDPVLSRFRVASAHRLGTCLYILHAIPSLDAVYSDEMVDMLLEELQQTLISIPEDDPNYKATAWITFVFGASVKTTEMKEWVIDRIKSLMLESPWGFLYAARDALHKLWGLHAEGKGNRSWVKSLRDLDMDFLVV
ncbi:fungal-specific transcription factor domain-containing protein [Dactylonectria estremocensis]|uniref:Fungal-specific transcription factor domain-containing protein n=1 Tax=Dactylonectria estremocensis TaxID=1079267 RepID=A0A9P9JGR9_9HYPO|nr:fungal-specific transcription factor domain-containing protein [Dactylonectria estremocensis]